MDQAPPIVNLALSASTHEAALTFAVPTPSPLNERTDVASVLASIDSEKSTTIVLGPAFNVLPLVGVKAMTEGETPSRMKTKLATSPRFPAPS